MLFCLYYVIRHYSIGANPRNILLGCSLCGLAVSLMWQMLSLTAAGYPAGGTVFAMLALGGDLGCSVGPWLTGIICGFKQSEHWTLMGMIFLP